MSKKIISTLERIIKKVNDLPNATKFIMDEYSSCVIGKTIGWPDNYNNQVAFKRYFDIENKKATFDHLDGPNSMPERHWKVIRLFTADIGETVSKKQWLDLVSPVLADLKVQYE